jgi:hypothetical protein
MIAFTGTITYARDDTLLPGEVLETTNGGGRACPSAALRAGLRAP